MKPLKSGLTFANWLMRISLAIMLVIMFMDEMKSLDFENKLFYIHSSFIVLGVLIFIGGFLAKPAVTVISGFLLTGLSVYKIIIQFSGGITNSISVLFVALSIGFYFACVGNQQ